MITEDELKRIKHLFNQEMELCACGNPEDGYELVRRLLNLAPFYEHPEKVTEVIGGLGAAHLILSMLSNARLIEHGGGIGGSWLTPKGVEVRDILQKVTSWDILDSWPEW